MLFQLVHAVLISPSAVQSSWVLCVDFPFWSASLLINEQYEAVPHLSVILDGFCRWQCLKWRLLLNAMHCLQWTALFCVSELEMRTELWFEFWLNQVGMGTVCPSSFHCFWFVILAFLKMLSWCVILLKAIWVIHTCISKTGTQNNVSIFRYQVCYRNTKHLVTSGYYFRDILSSCIAVCKHCIHF